MKMIRSKIVLTACLAGIGVVTMVAAAGDTAAAIKPDGAPAGTTISRTVLSTIDVPGSGYQVIEARVDIAANAHIPPHTHPGTVVAYLLAGDYSIRLTGQAARPLKPGESFVIPSGMVHEEFAGAHAARLIAVFTVEKGKPLTSPAQ